MGPQYYNQQGYGGQQQAYGAQQQWGAPQGYGGYGEQPQPKQGSGSKVPQIVLVLLVAVVLVYFAQSYFAGSKDTSNPDIGGFKMSEDDSNNPLSCVECEKDDACDLNACYLVFVSETYNEDTCNYIMEEKFADICFMYIAFHTADDTKCAPVVDPSNIETCTILAQEGRDGCSKAPKMSLCEKIADNLERKPTGGGSSKPPEEA